MLRQYSHKEGFDIFTVENLRNTVSLRNMIFTEYSNDLLAWKKINLFDPYGVFWAFTTKFLCYLWVVLWSRVTNNKTVKTMILSLFDQIYTSTLSLYIYNHIFHAFMLGVFECIIIWMLYFSLPQKMLTYRSPPSRRTWRRKRRTPPGSKRRSRTSSLRSWTSRKKPKL